MRLDREKTLQYLGGGAGQTTVARIRYDEKG
jgi:hypothetical protein